MTNIPFRVRIGVTGHRDLPDRDKIIALLRQAIDLIPSLFDAESRNALHKAGSNTPLRFTAVSALAQGADQLVADEVMRLPDPMLHVVIPLHLDDYTEGWTPPGLSCFAGLLAKCRNPVALRTERLDSTLPATELTRRRHEAYAEAGRYVVEHCDVLIAIWDPTRSGKPGGTEEAVAYARRRRRPVIRIWHDLTTPQLESGHGLNAGALEGIELFNKFTLAPEVEAREVSRKEEEHFGGPAASAVPPNIRDAIRELFPVYARASLLARKNQAHYRLTGTWGYMLSAAAVAAVALGTLWKAYAIPAYSFELATMLLITIVVLLAEKRHYASNWIESRFLTERLRTAMVLAACGVEPSHISVPPFMGQKGRSDDWTVRVFDEVWNQMPILTPPSPGNRGALGEYAVQNWLRGQIGFHAGKEAREGKANRRLHTTGRMVVVATILAAACHLTMGAFGVHEELSALEMPLTFVAISFPALGAALAGLRSHREHHRLEQRSRNMHGSLTEIVRSIEETATLEQLVKALREAEAATLHEAQDWLMLMRFVIFETA
jgi:hypothetical protein